VARERRFGRVSTTKPELLQVRGIGKFFA